MTALRRCIVDATGAMALGAASLHTGRGAWASGYIRVSCGVSGVRLMAIVVMLSLWGMELAEMVLGPAAKTIAATDQAQVPIPSLR